MKTMYEQYQVGRQPLRKMNDGTLKTTMKGTVSLISSLEPTKEKKLDKGDSSKLPSSNGNSCSEWLKEMLLQYKAHQLTHRKFEFQFLLNSNESSQKSGHVMQLPLRNESSDRGLGQHRDRQLDAGEILDLNRYLTTGIGIEVEVENALGINVPGWTGKRDESLRNDGAEYVTNFGYRLQDAPLLLDKLFDMMVKTKASEGNHHWTFNERTSIHVHLDCRKLSFEEVKSLLMVYTVFEDSLFKIAGEDRKHNVFCVPLRYVAMSNVARSRFNELIGTWKKYCAINLSCLMTFGTIEFRHMEGNNNKKRIAQWVFILAKMLDYCRVTSNAQVMKDLCELKFVSQYHQYAEKVFGPFANLIDIVPHEFDMAISDAKLFANVKV